MYRITIISVGKTKEKWLETAIAEYAKRLTATAELEFLWAKDDAQLLKHVAKEKALRKPIMCLDSEGKELDSIHFSSFVLKTLDKGGARLVFVIGGPEGLPQVLKKTCPLISLSRMTFMHQIVRLVLVEQLYRAFEIAKGTPYHKISSF